jgi:hypothetical protein
MKTSTIIIMMTAIIVTILFFVTLYARQVKVGIMFLFASALMWTIFAEELRLEKCQSSCKA